MDGVEIIMPLLGILTEDNRAGLVILAKD